MFKPTYNRVVVKELPSDNLSEGGLVLPGETPFRLARVVAVGPGGTSMNGTVIPICCAVDDTIMYSAGSGANITIEKENYRLLLDHEVLIVLS
jgi:co-chaperonin GroES (HSP10)